MDQKILKKLEQIEKNMLSKDDAKKFVTKDELKDELARQLELQKVYFTKELELQKESIIKDVVDGIIAYDEGIDEVKADKTQVERLEKRIDILERKASQY